MKKCKYCKSEIDSKATICPVCKQRQNKHGVLVGVLIFLFIGFVAMTINDQVNRVLGERSRAADDPEYIAANDGEMTGDEFLAIESGMTYAEVVEIIGGGGSLLSEVDLGMGCAYITQTCMWSGKGVLGASATITFQGGKVISKAQFGLSE